MSNDKKGKKHFTIPDNEVKREENKRKFIPELVEIDFKEHGMKISEGISSIKERNNFEHNILSNDILFFKFSFQLIKSLIHEATMKGFLLKIR